MLLFCYLKGMGLLKLAFAIVYQVASLKAAYSQQAELIVCQLAMSALSTEVSKLEDNH